MRLLKLICEVILLLALSQVCTYAEDSNSLSKQAVKSFNAVDLLLAFLCLILVLAMFFGLMWLLRKTKKFNLLQRNELSVVSGLSLGVREKLVLVKVGNKQLLLGVTAQRIDKLLELDGEQRLYLKEAQQATEDSFADKLMQFMQNKSNE